MASPHASLEIICGCMYSGKSEELIRRLRRALIARQAVQVFKPGVDDRFGEARVATHSGGRLDARPLPTAAAILAHVEPATLVVGIDEIQFFDPGVVAVVLELMRRGKRVVAAGLDLDFRGEPFGVMPELMARATEVTKLQAICMSCGDAATRSQRLIDGQPAGWDDPVIQVGATEAYEARCFTCHRVDAGAGR